MSITQKILACAAGVLGIAVLVYAAPPPAAMAIDLGLWEITTQGQMSGAPMIPPERLAQMPPEQRARIEAMLAHQNGRKFKQCMTEEKRRKGFEARQSPDNECKSTVVTNTSSEYEVHRVCTTDEGQVDSTAHFTIGDRHSASGKVDIVRTMGGRSTTIHTTIEAKWLGSDCGNVKDAELEK
jgi:hypothetical protein